jgi:hypothetical protein
MYSHHLKTGPSGFQMVIFWTQFGSGFQMPLAAILLKPFAKTGQKSPVLEWLWTVLYINININIHIYKKVQSH